MHLFVIAPSPPTTPKIQHSFPPPPSPPLPSPSVFSSHIAIWCVRSFFFFFFFFLFSLLTPPQRRPLRRVHSLVLLPLLCLSFSLFSANGKVVCGVPLSVRCQNFQSLTSEKHQIKTNPPNTNRSTLFSYNTFLLLAYLPFAEFRRLQFV